MSMVSPLTTPDAHPAPTDGSMLQAVVDALPAAVSLWDRDERNLVSNANVLPWFGLSPEQARGLTLRESVGPETYETLGPALAAVREGRTHVLHRTINGSGGTFRTGADGVRRHIEVTLTPTMVDGVFEGLTLMSSDVTAQTEALRSMDEAQQLAAVGSWTWSPDRPEHMVWSRQMYRVVGKDPATFRTTLTNYLACLHPDDVDRAVATSSSPLILDTSSTTDEYEGNYRVVLEDGEIRQVHSRARITRGPDGEIVMVQGTAQDVTELRRATDELATANALLSDMMGMIGHDVRQPLTVVTGYLEQVDDDWGDFAEADRRRYVRTSLDAGRRANVLIDDILMMVNLDSGSLTARLGTIRLGEFVPEAVQVAVPDLRVDVRRDGLVAVDPFHLRQIVTNLVLNAVRYGREPLEIVVDADDEHGYISVTDAGDGVPEDFVPHLFERFTRATTGVAATMNGSGFGLYIITQLLAANGGLVTYRPAEPHGSCFTVTLPLLRR